MAWLRSTRGHSGLLRLRLLTPSLSCGHRTPRAFVAPSVQLPLAAPTEWARCRCCSTACGGRDIRWLLKTEIGVCDEVVKSILRLHPALEEAQLDQVSSNLSFLRKEACISELASAVARIPALLTASVVDQLAPALHALRDVLPGAWDVAAAAWPEALLRPAAEFAALKESYERAGVNFEKLVERAPGIILAEIATINRVFDFLVNSDIGPGFKKETVGRAHSSFPFLLVSSSDPMSDVALLTKYLREELGVDTARMEDSCVGLYALPNALAVVQENVQFLLNECDFSLEELREDVQLLVHSVDDYLRPRALYARQLRTKRPTLKMLAALDDARFSRIVGGSLESYQKFRLSYAQT